MSEPGLDRLVREAEQRVRALERELGHDEQELARVRARAANADANVERWWFGGGRVQRALVALKARLFR